MNQSDRRTTTAAPVLLALCLALTVTGCTPKGPDAETIARQQAAEEATIRQLDADWVKAAQAKNADQWVSFYADGAAVLPPNDKLMTDKATIRKAFGEMLSLPGLSLTWQPAKVEVAKSGDLAYLYGAYTLKMNDDKGQPVTDTGKIAEVWKKQADGTWKCVMDMWSSDLPVPAPAAK